MKLLVCTIYDKVAEKAEDNFLACNEAAAVRAVKQILSNSKPLQVMANDLELRVIGFFDNVSTELSQLPSGHLSYPLSDMLNNDKILPSESSEVSGE